MKKIILPMLAVIVAIGLSAFTASKPLRTSESLYWFQVVEGAGDETDFNNEEAYYISGPTETVPLGVDCNTGNYRCVIGFREDQLDGFLINDHQPAVTGVGRSRSTE